MDDIETVYCVKKVNEKWGWVVLSATPTRLTEHTAIFSDWFAAIGYRKHISRSAYDAMAKSKEEAIVRELARLQAEIDKLTTEWRAEIEALRSL
jgi:hypothetical protein